MFIRVKKRKNKAEKIKMYAYLVQSRHYKTKKTPRQKVKEYLGRVYRFDRKKALGALYEPDFIINNSYETILKSIIAKELESRGFKKEGDIFERDALNVDLVNKKVFDKTEGNKACIALNDGFLTNYTLKQVLDFKPPEATEREIGKSLGNAIVAAGLPVDHGLFIALFRKVMASLDDNEH